MCGICGIVDLVGRRLIDEQRIVRMSSMLRHRGPDGDGMLMLPGLALGHRRLAIIDVEGGRQPLFNETGSIACVYNGEIYNFLDLSDELARRGHRFATRCDTEVVVHAWEEWGDACVERFDGMFAFALWDDEAQTLFLARDRIGEKPLYYTLTADGLIVFASELDPVLAALPETPALELEAVEEFFAFGYIPDPRTIRRGIFKLPPAHTLRLRRGEPSESPRRYWELSFAAKVGEVAPERAAAELASRLSRSVSSRMISDMPLGAFLSGGLDSSVVVALMAQASPLPVRTCSIAFDDQDADESPYARLVADRYSTDHVSSLVEPDACALVDRLAEIYDEPFADPSAIPTYLLSELARRHVTVALSGDGGDEVFAGYPRYAAYAREERAKRLAPAILRRRLFGPTAALMPKLDWAPRPMRVKPTLEALAEDAVGGYFRAVTALPTPLRRAVYSGDFKAALRGYDASEVLRAHAARAETPEPVALAQYLDLKTVLPGGMLVKVDRASMAHSLEVRAPFLDHSVIEWAARVPLNLKLCAGEGKRVLKLAMRRHLPPEIIHRPKRGFSPPLARWLRRELAPRLFEVIRSRALIQSGFFDMPRLARLVEAHVAGRADHATALWAILTFDAFLRHEPDPPPGVHSTARSRVAV